MLRLRVVLLLVACLIPVLAKADESELTLRRSTGPRADVAALILGGRESGTLRATGMAFAPCLAPTNEETGKGTVPVDLIIEVEGRSLLDAVSATTAEEIPETVRVELYAYVMNRAGEIVESTSRWVRASLLQLTRRPPGGIKLIDQLELPPGEYQARVLVREPTSQRFSLRILEVFVPSPNDSTPALSLPLFGDGEGAWLIAAATGATEDRPPSALPVVSPVQHRSFRLHGCRLAEVEIEGSFRTRSGEEVAGTEIRLEAPRAVNGVQMLDGEMTIPELESGLYVLTVTARVPEHETSRTLPMFLSADARVTSWTGVGSLEPEPEVRRGTLDVAAESGSRKRVEAIEGSYLGVLELLADGRREDSIDALARMEASVLEMHENRRKSLKWLAEGENRVTRRLLDVDPECLLPLLMLHLETQGRYVASGDVEDVLLEASRSRVRALAEVYASDAKQEMASALAAAALAELATDLQDSGHLISALLVLRDALALDPANIDVLLELSHRLEHHGFREESRRLLRHLLDIEPQSDEGRLRLAVGLIRSEREHEALELLRDLIANGTSEWVVAVAYQELARHFLRSDEFAEARNLLAGSVDRLPAIQRLRIGLAYALDRLGERPESRAMATALPADRGFSSPRLLYRVPERGDTLRSRRELVRHATARIPLLAAALPTARNTR